MKKYFKAHIPLWTVFALVTQHTKKIALAPYSIGSCWGFALGDNANFMFRVRGKANFSRFLDTNIRTQIFALEICVGPNASSFALQWNIGLNVFNAKCMATKKTSGWNIGLRVQQIPFSLTPSNVWWFTYIIRINLTIFPLLVVLTIG